MRAGRLMAAVVLFASMSAAKDAMAGNLACVPTGGKLYVDASAADYIEVIDLETRKAVKKIKVGKHPHGLALGCRVVGGQEFNYVYATVESTGELVIVDAQRDKVVKRVKVGRVPNQLTITADGGAVYVPLREEARVAVVRLDYKVTSIYRFSDGGWDSYFDYRPKVIKRIPIGEWPHNAYTGQTTGRVYVTSFKGKKIHVFDPKKDDELAYEMEFPGEVRPVALSRDETRAYVAQSGLHGFLVADLVERKVIERVELPPLPPETPVPYLNTYVHGLTLSPDEKELWVTSCAGAAVYVYSVPELKLRGKVGTGKFPHWFAWEKRKTTGETLVPLTESTRNSAQDKAMPYPEGWLLWVSQMESNQVSAIDPVKREVVATVPTGPAPRRIVISNQ